MGSAENTIQYDAVLVAGEGENSHRVCNRHKALLKIKDKYVIHHVIEALQQVPSIGDIYVAGPMPKLVTAFQTGGINMSTPKRIRIVPQKSNLFENAWNAFLNTLPGYHQGDKVDLSDFREKAVLIVPCDAPLITPREVAYFIDHSNLDRYDYVLGLTPEHSLTHFYPRGGMPGVKMAYLHMREKSYRINNLHLVRPIKVFQRKHVNTMYAFRYQKNIINALLLGLYLMGKEQPKSLQFLSGLQLAMLSSRLRFSNLAKFFSQWTPKPELETAISGLMKTRFHGLEVPYPGAALDIDNNKDYHTMTVMFGRWRDYLMELKFN